MLSLQSLLSTPEPKDPQDAEVANLLLRNPQEFERTAREWAVIYAGAPKKHVGESSGGATAASIRQKEIKSKQEQEQEELAAYVHPVVECRLSANRDCHRYEGYNKDLIDRFCSMGFDVPRVVAAFKYVGIDRMDGEDYELEEAYMGDVTARLLGEP